MKEARQTFAVGESARLLTGLHQETEAPVVVEKTIGRCVVYFVGADHRVIPREYPLDTIERYIQTTDKTIVEYFIPELDETVFTAPILGSFMERYAFHAKNIPFYYGLVEKKASKYEKNVLVLDPDNNLSFYLWRQALAPVMVATGIAGVAVAALGNNLRSLRTGEITRRQFLRLISGAVLATAGLGAGPNMNMDDVRWVTVAQGLTQYCQTDPSQRLAAIYPPTAINGILFYLDNPGERRKMWSVYSKIPSITREIRQYDPLRGWKLVRPPTPIG